MIRPRTTGRRLLGSDSQLTDTAHHQASAAPRFDSDQRDMLRPRRATRIGDEARRPVEGRRPWPPSDGFGVTARETGVSLPSPRCVRSS